MTATVPTAIKNLLVFLLDSPSLELLIICICVESNSLWQNQRKLLCRILVVLWVLGAVKTWEMQTAKRAPPVSQRFRISWCPVSSARRQTLSTETIPYSHGFAVFLPAPRPAHLPTVHRGSDWCHSTFLPSAPLLGTAKHADLHFANCLAFPKQGRCPQRKIKEKKEVLPLEKQIDMVWWASWRGGKMFQPPSLHSCLWSLEYTFQEGAPLFPELDFPAHFS